MMLDLVFGLAPFYPGPFDLLTRLTWLQVLINTVATQPDLLAYGPPGPVALIRPKAFIANKIYDY